MECKDSNAEYRIDTIDDVERAFAEVIAMEIKRDRASLPYRQRIAECERRVYELVGQIPAQIQGRLDAIRRYAAANPELFAEKKTLKLQHGTITHREGRPAVKIIDGHEEEDAITCIERKESYRYLLTQVPQIDRELILRLFKAGEVTGSELKSLHLEVRQTVSIVAKPASPKAVDVIAREGTEAADGEDIDSEM